MKFKINKFLVAVFLFGFRALGAMDCCDFVNIDVRYNNVQLENFVLPGNMTIQGLINHCISLHDFRVMPAQAQSIKDRYSQYQSSFNNLSCYPVTAHTIR